MSLNTSRAESRVMNEISRLRKMKVALSRSVRHYSSIPLEISNICMSVDLLLQPLYWYCMNSESHPRITIECYQHEAMDLFKDNAEEIIRAIYLSVSDLQREKGVRWLNSYCATLRECFPNILTH